MEDLLMLDVPHSMPIGLACGTPRERAAVPAKDKGGRSQVALHAQRGRTPGGRTLVLGHRGASAYAPENTFAAFDLAMELGADGIETDVRVTRDGVLVLLHDETVDRTTDGTGLVAELCRAELDALDAGSWFEAAYAG